MSMLDTTAARREARAAIAAALSRLDADGAAYLARKITPAMDMMTALSDELDDARQTIGVQKAALAGAATTVNRASAEVCRALDRAHAAEAEVARLREAMPDADVLESAALLASTVAPDSRLRHRLSDAAARIRALDAGVDTTEEATNGD